MRQQLFILTSLFLSLSNVAYAAKCTDYSTCRQAVIAWCNDEHPRADGDGDGIPCENVCNSRAQVEAIKREIGCDK